jgi:hypothetical protein
MASQDVFVMAYGVWRMAPAGMLDVHTCTHSAMECEADRITDRIADRIADRRRPAE